MATYKEPTYTRLWSKRYSVARGWHWQGERIISDLSKANQWLEVFKRDEPTVEFVLSKMEPRYV